MERGLFDKAFCNLRDPFSVFVYMLDYFCDTEKNDPIYACFSSTHHFVCMFDVPPVAKAEVKVMESVTDAV